jgi:hypothetical protein
MSRDRALGYSDESDNKTEEVKLDQSILTARRQVSCKIWKVWLQRCRRFNGVQGIPSYIDKINDLIGRNDAAIGQPPSNLVQAVRCAACAQRE